MNSNKLTGAVVSSEYFVGLDLGQAADPSAIAVVQRAELVGEWDGAAFTHRREIELRLRHLERMELGMKYPEIERKVSRMMGSEAMAGTCCLLVDATGVGRPVVDHLRESGLGEKMLAVMVTGGQMARSEGGFEYVPKRDLIVGLQLLFEDEALRISAELKHVGTLKQEMADMQVRITPSGTEQFGAWREGEHDDLVFAVALACWGAKKAHGGRVKGVDGHWANQEAWRRMKWGIGRR
jgi:hypothetical protein